MIDIHVEHLVTINKAPREIPGRPHVATVWRWLNRGVRGVRLESVLMGGQRFTSREALQRFADRVTSAAAGESIATQTNRQRQRAMDEADKILDAARV